MATDKEKIDLFLQKLDMLERQQAGIQQEINNLKSSVRDLNVTLPSSPKSVSEEVIEKDPSPPAEVNIQSEPLIIAKTKIQPPKVKIDFEKFIGENLINKIGIAILVIGVGIGAKYAIEREMFNPLTRIIMGYVVGATLLFFAIRLKGKYLNYSAVLLSGSMAIFYFITFMASSFYGLIPIPVSFVIMVFFTVFTVVSALHYDQKIIALLGLVGAYGVPFLLSDNSGRVTFFFSYISILNIGILAVAIKKYWKLLYYSSFGLTWLIFFVWYFDGFRQVDHFALAAIFCTLFFVIFYLTALSYKIIKKETFNWSDILLISINSLFFYGTGYSLLADHSNLEVYLGLFTLLNAIMHFMVAFFIYRRKAADKQLFYFIAGLVLVFITVTIPVQLDGNPVTIIWIAEAVLLFWIGRTKKIIPYEKLSYPLILIAFFSQLHDWIDYSSYHVYQEGNFTPLFNVDFLGSILFTIGIGVIYYFHKKFPLEEGKMKQWMSAPLPYIIGGIFLISLFNSFRFEIELYWGQLYEASKIDLKDEFYTFQYNNHLLRFENIWLINYFIVFTSLLMLVNQYRLKERILAIVSLIMSAFACILFLTDGLYDISELREAYLQKELTEFYPANFMYLGIRYISLTFLALLVTIAVKNALVFFPKKQFLSGLELATHVIILWVVSSELLHWLDIFGGSSNYKLGLTITWGIYALIMVILGIWKNNKAVRIAAIVLFGATLIKLFFYDISHLNLISKAIVFISLGVIMLLVSFLYNKYKNSIIDDGESK